MLTGIHVILTYMCNFECDHCFLYCSPKSSGTCTINQITDLLDEAKKIGTIEWIFYEGGEPMLYYPLMVEGILRATEMGFKAGVVTNAYGANCKEDAKLWLKPLKDAGLSFLNISNDAFHYGDVKENPAFIAASVAKELGIDCSPISIEEPKIVEATSNGEGKGRPVIGGGAKFRGRAVEKLAKDLPLRPWIELNTCPYEDLASPSRIHLDALGNVQLCQGLNMGNMRDKPLSEMVAHYQPESHPICGPLIQGGPAQLAKTLNINHEEEYIDECHFCYFLRRSIIDDYPEYLGPKQVYGLDEEA